MERIISGNKIKEVRYNETSKTSLEIELNDGTILEFKADFYRDYDVAFISYEVKTNNIWDNK